MAASHSPNWNHRPRRQRAGLFFFLWRQRKRLFFTYLLLFTFGSGVSWLLSNSSAPPSNRTGSPGDGGLSCSASGCHTGGPAGSAANIAVYGLPSEYVAGSTYTLTVHLSTSAGLPRAGFELVAETGANVATGTYSNFDAKSQTIGDGAGHKVADTSNFTWSFDWTAPPNAGAGTITFYVAGNAANNNGTTSGDQINLKSIAVPEAAPTAELAVVLAGQTFTDGIGVTGNTVNETAGENILYTVYAVDASSNRVAGIGKTGGIRMTSDDSFAQSSWTLTMTDGVATGSVNLRTGGERKLTASDQSGTSPLLGSVDSSTFTLLPNLATRLRVLMPGETAVPGSTTTGRTGAVLAQTAGVAITATVQITDSFWNLIPATSQQVRIVPTDPFATVTPSTLTVTGSATVDVVFKTAGSNPIRAEDKDNPVEWGLELAADDGSTVAVAPGAPQRFLMIVPGETFNPGSPVGKAGTPNASLKAGSEFFASAAVVDAFNNPVTGLPAVVETVVPPEFPFVVNAATAAINAATGKTDPTDLRMTLLAKATWHQLIAREYLFAAGLAQSPLSSTFTVSANDPYGLQLLLPGEVNAGGLGTFPDGGRSGTISTQTAGVPFNVTVNVVDFYNNVVPGLDKPNVYIVTNDRYDIEPTTGPVSDGSRTFAVRLVTKSTYATLGAYPRIQAADEVCTAAAGNVCVAASPAPFKVYAGAAAKLHVILPGETIAQGKCDVSPTIVCKTLTPGDPPGKSGLPSSFALTDPPTSLSLTAYVTDAFYNVATEKTGALQDTNPPAVMPEVGVVLPVDYLAAPPSTAALTLGQRTFSYDPIVALSTYTVGVATSPDSAVAYASATSSEFPVYPGPAHHLHLDNAPANVVAGSPFSATLNAHDKFHNLLSTGPNLYLGSVALSAEVFGPPQDAIISSPVTFAAQDDGAKVLANAFTLKKSGLRWIKGEQVGNSTITTEVAGFSVQPVVAVNPGPPTTVLVTPGPTSASLEVGAGTLLAPGQVEVYGQLSDVYNNPIVSGASVTISVADVAGAAGTLLHKSGASWLEWGVSTTVVADSLGRVADNGDPDNLNTPWAYLVSSKALDTARVWMGTTTAPADLLPHIASQRNLSATIQTVGGPAGSIALTAVVATAPVSATPGAPGSDFTLVRYDDFANATSSGALTVTLALDSAHAAAHAAAGYAPGVVGTGSGDYGFTEASTPFDFTEQVAFVEGANSVSFRYRDKMASYSGTSPDSNTAVGGRPGHWRLVLTAQTSPPFPVTSDLALDPLAPASLVFGNSPLTLKAGTPTDLGGSPQTFLARLRDAFGNPSTAVSSVTVNLSTLRTPSASLDAVAFSSAPDVLALPPSSPPAFAASTNSVVVAALAYETSFYYLDTNAQSLPTLTLADYGGALASTSSLVALVADLPTVMSLSPGGALVAGTTSPALSLTLQDRFGNASPLLPGLEDPGQDHQAFDLSSNSGGALFSSPSPGAFAAGPGVARIGTGAHTTTFYLIDSLVSATTWEISVAQKVRNDGWTAEVATYSVSIDSVSALPAFSTTTLDSSLVVGEYTSIALDSSGNPHISYFDVSFGDLQYARWNGSSWILVAVDTTGLVGWYSSIALDDAGNPHISYYDASNGDLKHGKWNGSSWDLEAVDTAGSVGYYTSIALDGAGNPRIAYWDAANGDLKYAKWNGSSWDLEAVDTAGIVGQYASLVLDGAGNPHISYYDFDNTDLKYAKWNGSSWGLEVVDAAGSVGEFNSIALDGSGNPHISYWDSTNGDLKHAKWNGSSWDLEAVDTGGDVGGNTSIALDGSGNPHISYRDVTNSDLKYAKWNGSSWDLATVDTAGDVGRFTSIVLDGSGKPHISYYDATKDDLKFAWTGDLPGPPETGTLKTWDGGGSSGLASEAANWTGDILPVTGDEVLLDATTTQTIEWDLPGVEPAVFTSSGFAGSIRLSTHLVVTGDFDRGTSGITFLGDSRLTVRGDFHWGTGGSALNGDNRITLAGAVRQEVSAGVAWLPNFHIESSSEVVLTTPVNFLLEFRHASGDLYAGDYAHYFRGTWERSGGNFYAQGSTWTFGAQLSSTTIRVSSGTGAFANFRVEDLAPPSATTVEFLSPLDIDGNFSHGNARIEPGTFTHTVQGDWNQEGGTFTATAGTILFNGPGRSEVRTLPGSFFHHLTIARDASAAHLTAYSDVVVNGSMTVTQGAWSPLGYTHRFRGALVSPNGRFLSGWGTTILDGTSPQTISGGSNNFWNLVVDNPAGVSLPGATFGLNVQRTLDIRPGSSLDASGDDFSVGGNFVSSGVFTALGSTLAFNGSSTQTILSNGAAYGALSVRNTTSPVVFASSFTAASFMMPLTGRTAWFQAGSTFTVGDFSPGADGLASRVRLRSTTPGLAWGLNVTGSASPKRVDVADSDASLGIMIEAAAGDNLDSGNNVNWDFGSSTTLVAQDVGGLYSGQMFVASATLTGADGPLSGKTVVFDFSGSTAEATTDSTGLATTLFTAPAATGTYNYTASFPGDEGLDASADTDNAVTVGAFRHADIDDAPNAGAWSSAATDSRGNIHVSYCSGAADQKLRYSRRDAETGLWDAPTVVDSDAAGAGQWTSIAVDPQDRPRITYTDAAFQELRYAAYTGSAWTVATVASPPAGVGAGTSLALDAAGNPHVAYSSAAFAFPSDTYSLIYARSADGGETWTLDVVAADINAGSQKAALALDAAGRPRIAFADGSNGNVLRYAYKDGAGWQVRNIFAGPTAYVSLALDGQGGPHIAFALSPDGLGYARSPDGGTTWSTQTLRTGLTILQGTSISLDGGGNPHIGYNDSAAVGYAYSPNGGITFSTVPAPGRRGDASTQNIALTFGPDGRPHFAYSYLLGGLGRLGHTVTHDWAFAVPAGGNRGSRLQAPSGLAATAVHVSSAVWSWTDDASNELGYRLYGSEDPDGPFTLLAGTDTIGPGQTSYVETSAPAGKTVYRYIAAVNAGGFAPSPVSSATLKAAPPGLRVWDGGGADALASNRLNWTGDIAPGTGDSVRFDATSTKSCSWDQAGVTLVDFTIAAGFTLSAGVTALSTLDIDGDFTLSAGTFTAGPFTHTVAGDWSHSAGSFIHGGGTIQFDGAADSEITSLPGSDFSGLSIAKETTDPGVVANSNIVVHGTMSVTSGSWVPMGYTHRFRGNIYSPLGQMLAGTGTTYLDGTSPQALSAGSNNFWNVVIQNTAGVSLPGNTFGLNVQGDLVIEPGAAFDATGDNFTVQGDFISSGTFVGLESTMTFNGTSPQYLWANGATLGYLRAHNTSTLTFATGFAATRFTAPNSSATLYFAAGSTFTVARFHPGDSDIGDRVRLRSTSPGSPWYLVVTSTARPLRVDVSDSDASGGATLRAYAGDNTDSGGNTNWAFSQGLPPAEPMGTVLGTSSISWTWAAYAGATHYRVYPGSAPGSLLTTQEPTTYLRTGLAANRAHSISISAEVGPIITDLARSATLYTLANPPTGTTVSAVYTTSAAISWGLNGNPDGTLAHIEFSADNVNFTQAAITREVSFTRYGLLGCTSYYFRTRYANWDQVYTEYDSTVSLLTSSPTPLPPGGLRAQSLAGAKIGLAWNKSPFPGVSAYRIYTDLGTGTIDYGTPLATVGAAQTSYETPVLTSGNRFLFGLRAVHSCGVEEKNTFVRAQATALTSLTGVRARIKVPESGKAIGGNRVTIVAELTLGDRGQTEQLEFQYKVSSAATGWTAIPAVDTGGQHPNPVTTFPYLMHWDVSTITETAYDLRVVAKEVFGSSDTAPSAITLTIDRADPDEAEGQITTGGNIGKVEKRVKIHNQIESSIQSSDPGSTQVTQVTIPPGAITESTVTVSVINKPTVKPPDPPELKTPNIIAEIKLSNDQHDFKDGNTALVTLAYPDSDDDDIVDGTTIKARDMKIYSARCATCAWVRDFNTTVNLASKTISGYTPHFSFFAAFVPAAAPAHADLSAIRVYPNPFKPNSGDPNDGTPFATGVADTGITFDQLPPGAGIKIYSVTGQLVAELDSSAGAAVQWDARNNAGRDVASGLYIAVITSNGQVPVVRKVLVVR